MLSVWSKQTTEREKGCAKSMITYLPGTTIEADLARDDTEYILKSIFSMGGLVLSQVAQLAGLEPYDVQNWVKRGFCTPPVSKKYSKKQFCRIILINMLKDCLSLGEIVSLLSYINGTLNDESDDMIDDDRLYIYLVRTLAGVDVFSEKNVEKAVEAAIADYNEPFPGGRTRLFKVLSIMTYAYYSTRIHRSASAMMASLDSI